MYMSLDSNNRPNGWDLVFVEGYVEVDESIHQLSIQHPDWIWNGSGLVAAPPVEPVEPVVYIPTSVTMRQARLQLSVLQLYPAVNQAVAGMSEQAQIEWEYATTVDRNNTLTQQMIALLGWSEQEADAYFVAASAL